MTNHSRNISSTFYCFIIFLKRTIEKTNAKNNIMCTIYVNNIRWKISVGISGAKG